MKQLEQSTQVVDFLTMSFMYDEVFHISCSLQNICEHLKHLADYELFDILMDESLTEPLL